MMEIYSTKEGIDCALIKENIQTFRVDTQVQVNLNTTKYLDVQNFDEVYWKHSYIEENMDLEEFEKEVNKPPVPVLYRPLK